MLLVGIASGLSESPHVCGPGEQRRCRKGKTSVMGFSIRGQCEKEVTHSSTGKKSRG